MEKRAALAFALSILVLFAYLWVMETFFVAPQTARQEAPAPPTPAPAPMSRPEAPAPAAPAVAPVTRSRASPRPPQRTARLTAPLYQAVVSSEGGKLLEWTLHYRGEKPMVVVGELGPRGLVVGPAPSSAEPLPMTVSTDAVVLGSGAPTGELVLTGEVGGLRVRETLRVRADDFSVDALIRVENTSPAPQTVTLTLPWVYHHRDKGPPEPFPGQRPTEVVWKFAAGVERVEDLQQVGSHEIEGAWVAMGSTWYLAALVPKTPGFKLLAAGDAKKDAQDGEYRVTVGARATPTVGPGQAWEGRVLMFVGPKEYERLEAHGLESTVNFGGFPLPKRYGGLPMEWLGVPILKLMNWLYGFVGNYGIVIIVVTVISKVLFYPLTVKSIRSMKAMQALQPQINNLRNKYRSDPRKLQEETLALYRKHKVNPMGGCLPMVAQVPVFYALYLALSVSVELQNAPFLCFGRAFAVDLWICDLAGQDPTYVLPILMGVSMFVQQKMTPTMGDPRQARIMLVMPFVFTFMFLNLPSGLVLYWFVSNVLQIAQQWWMDRPGPASANEPARA
jgi:YidC/Oxa1 family membrane protein insertase